MAPHVPYELGQQLGKGGFATVFQGRNGSDKTVAVKVVQSASLKPTHSQKFLAEMIIHSKLQHPQIVQFFEAYPYKDTTHIALELCPNGSLKEMQAKRITLTYPELRRFGIQLCSALHYLHSKSIVHRDIKLQNILLDADMNVKLADFGLVGILKSDDDKDVIKRLTLCGTPNYMAPEMWGRQGHDQKLDIWALGAALFYLAVGWAPFSRPGDKDIEAIKARAKKIDIQWPNESALCAQLRELLEVMMHPEEEQRPSAIDVVRQSFFSMRGGIPPTLEPTCRTSIPTWANGRRREMWAYATKIPLEEFMEQCGMKSMPQKSIIKEIEKEEVARQAPSLPLKGVYKPKAPGKPLADITNKPKRTISRAKTPKASCIGPSDVVEPLSEVPLTTLSSNLRQALKLAESHESFDHMSAFPTSPTSCPPPLVHTYFTHSSGLGYMLANGDVGAMLSESVSAFAIRPHTPEIMSFFARNETNSQFEQFNQRIDALQSPKAPDAHFSQRQQANKICESYMRHLDKKKEQRPPSVTPITTTPAFIKTFCRVGTAQAFVFGAGGVQFNFPDKTKLVISPEGDFISFYHLPLELARQVQAKQTVESEIDHKFVIHMPLSIMLSCSSSVNQWLFELLQANEFKQKLGFVKDVLRVWEQSGGPGKGQKLDWSGMSWVREDAKVPHWGSFEI